jgi:hypothetical protein
MAGERWLRELPNTGHKETHGPGLCSVAHSRFWTGIKSPLSQMLDRAVFSGSPNKGQSSFLELIASDSVRLLQMNNQTSPHSFLIRNARKYHEINADRGRISLRLVSATTIPTTMKLFIRYAK